MWQVNFRNGLWRQVALTLCAILIFAASALLSYDPQIVHAQFIDRITRPCAVGGNTRSLVQTTSTDVWINPCPGANVTINGVPLVIIPGGGLGDPGSNGVVVRTALNTTVARTLTGTANQVIISNGSGVAGNPTFSLPQSIAVASTPVFAGLTLSGLTANAFLYSGTVGLLTSTAAPTNGQLLIGSTGAAPVRATPTASAPLGITLGAGTLNFTCATCGITTNPLSQFTATTSAQLAGVISDETGSGPLVFATSPVFTAGVHLGTVSSATGQINLANSASAFLTTIQAGNAAAARTYTWPTDFGAAGSVLTDAAGNGTLSWAAAGSGLPAGLTFISPNFTVATAAANQAVLSGSAAASPISLAATGSDTNIGINVTPKGSGRLVVSTSIDLTNGTASISGPGVIGWPAGGNFLYGTGNGILVGYGGVAYANIGASGLGIILENTAALGWGSGSPDTNNRDTRLFRAAAAVVGIDDAHGNYGDIKFRHVIGSSTAPTIANGAGAGTSPGTPTLTGSDAAGQISIITGTLPSVSAVAVTVTFNAAYGTAPYVVIWPANAAAATLGFLPYVSSTTTTFTINTGSIALGGSTTYLYNYVVVQ